MFKKTMILESLSSLSLYLLMFAPRAHQQGFREDAMKFKRAKGHGRKGGLPT
jgi:hypothetical protein